MSDVRSVSEIVGLNLAALRGVIGASQEELARAMASLGFAWHRQTVTEVEAGRRGVTVEEVAALAAYFDMSPLALIVSPSSMLNWSAGVTGVRIGSRVIRNGDWVNLWSSRETYPHDEPPRPHHRAAIDRLMRGVRRPWAKLWRERGGVAVSSFAEVREKRLRRRRRHPGPVYALTIDEPLTRSVGRPPWGEAYSISLFPGEPYTARDEFEAIELARMEQDGVVRNISRQTAYRMRQARIRREKGS